MRRVTTVLIAVFVCGWVAYADQLAKGDKELNFTFSFADEGDDGNTDTETANLEGMFGWMLTDHHEVGGLVGYSKTEVDAPGTGGDSSFDGTQIGAFYAYNFRAGANLNPYVDVHWSVIGGDKGDVVDDLYGITGGLKIYPWENGGFNFGVSFDKSSGAGTFPDSDTTTTFAGVAIKWE